MGWIKKLALPGALIIGIAAASSDYSAHADAPCSVPVVVHSDGSIEFDGTRIKDDAKLTALLVQYRTQNPKCAMRISADEVTNFQAVGRVIFAMQKAGFLKVGFLIEPPN